MTDQETSIPPHKAGFKCSISYGQWMGTSCLDSKTHHEFEDEDEVEEDKEYEDAEFRNPEVAEDGEEELSTKKRLRLQSDL